MAGGRVGQLFCVTQVGKNTHQEGAKKYPVRRVQQAPAHGRDPQACVLAFACCGWAAALTLACTLASACTWALEAFAFTCALASTWTPALAWAEAEADAAAAAAAAER